MKRLLSLIFFLIVSVPASAQNELIMVRSVQAFPETMTVLQQAIQDHGYTISRVQRVDIGLTAMGYQTDKYRVVFFGKHEQQKMLTAKHPELIPYLPIKIAIFAEGEETILVASNPELLAEFFPDPKLEKFFVRCASDMRSIMKQVQDTEF
jgi:uncharacterized protein (DUF302 family)